RQRPVAGIDRVGDRGVGQKSLAWHPCSQNRAQAVARPRSFGPLARRPREIVTEVASDVEPDAGCPADVIGSGLSELGGASAAMKLVAQRVVQPGTAPNRQSGINAFC